jgi:UPF0176 protein
MYHVLLYYKIQKISHPSYVVKRHREVCKALQLRGRILISNYGINGTVAGSPASIDLYKAYMDQHRLFSKIDFKQSTSEAMPFPRLSVKVRKEIITTQATDEYNIWNVGTHITRDTLHEWFLRGEEFVLLDMRNDYEWEIGRFKGSVKPPMKYFRDLKDCMDFYMQFQGKKLVLFCTGGIRCEPATAMFLQAGFDRSNLFQLEGGIVKYAEKYGDDGFYEGKCFVFDDRIAIPINTTDTAVVTGHCSHCNTANDSYYNCLNKFCNKLFLSCATCIEEFQGCCSSACATAIESPGMVRPPRSTTYNK